MVTTILISVLAASVLLNLAQLKKHMKTTEKGRAALEAIADVSNYVQESVISSEKIEEVKAKLNNEALKTIAQQTFLAKGLASSIREDLLKLWAQGKAKIKKIF